MELLHYPVELHKEKDGITVTFPDMPYGVTCGDTKEAALANAVDCLEEVITSLMKDKKSIPKPSHAHKRPTITLSPTLSIKVLLFKGSNSKF